GRGVALAAKTALLAARRVCGLFGRGGRLRFRDDVARGGVYLYEFPALGQAHRRTGERGNRVPNSERAVHAIGLAVGGHRHLGEREALATFLDERQRELAERVGLIAPAVGLIALNRHFEVGDFFERDEFFRPNAHPEVALLPRRGILVLIDDDIRADDRADEPH